MIPLLQKINTSMGFVSKRIREQLRFLRSIGTAEMERKFEKKVLEVTKLNEDSLIQQSGIEPTLTNEEISNLIMEVKKELRSERTAQSSGDL